MDVVRLAKNRIRVGLVVLARIPYAERNDYKIRPCVVEHSSGDELVVRPCTSSLRGIAEGGAQLIDDLESAGLSRRTAIREASLRVPLTDVVDVIGVLSERDLVAVLSRGAFERAA